MRRAERCPEGRRPRHGAWADALTQRSTFSLGAVLVPGAGIEPALPIGKGILSPLRLPFRHPGPGRTSRFLPVFLQASAGSADERVHPLVARRGTLRRKTSATTGKKKEKNMHTRKRKTFTHKCRPFVPAVPENQPIANAAPTKTAPLPVRGASVSGAVAGRRGTRSGGVDKSCGGFRVSPFFQNIPPRGVFRTGCFRYSPARRCGLANRFSSWRIYSAPCKSKFRPFFPPAPLSRSNQPASRCSPGFTGS